MIDVSFEHWRYTFTEEMLIKYGSPYFSRKDAGNEYFRDVVGRSERISFHDLGFSENQIVSGNEAFSEAAVADPIADLEVWDEWRSGTRSFPYQGVYRRLGITRQDAKTSSPSSVGVIGEIMAGFFAQAGVSPWVLVRVVRRWPDFIFSDRNGTYSFVESKAFTGKPAGEHGLMRRVRTDLVVEGVVEAAQQLNSDPFGRVWNSLTRISSVDPMQFDVTFVEFNVPEPRRASQTVKPMPAAVAEGLAERAVNQAAAAIGIGEIDERLVKPAFRRETLVPMIRKQTHNEIDTLLDELGQELDAPAARTSIEHAVDALLSKIASKKWTPPKHKIPEGRRLMEAKKGAVQGQLSRIRRSGDGMIFLADLPRDDIPAIKRDWAPDWSRATLPWGTIDGVELWRCGGAVICLGNAGFAGREIVGGRHR